VQVKRQVRAVERDVVTDQASDAAVGGPGEGLAAAPKQPVMDEQERHALLGGEPHRRLAQVDGRADPRHGPGVRHLEAVERPGIVGDRGDPQIGVQVGHEFAEVHGATGGDSVATLSHQTVHSDATFPHSD